jgi:excinuclease ABC subunit B
MDFNKQHGITPKTIVKGVRQVIEATKVAEESVKYGVDRSMRQVDGNEIQEMIARLTEDMKLAAADLQFERAAALRDKINELKAKE